MPKYSWKSSGKSFECQNCTAQFFLPSDMVDYYKKEGCPHCGSKKWKNLRGGVAFIKAKPNKPLSGTKIPQKHTDRGSKDGGLRNG